MASLAGCARDVNAQYRRHVQEVFREVNTSYLDVYSSDEDSSQQPAVQTEDINQKKREKADTPPPQEFEGDKCEHTTTWPNEVQSSVSD